jgi:hypothetical protein
MILSLIFTRALFSSCGHHIMVLDTILIVLVSICGVLAFAIAAVVLCICSICIYRVCVDRWRIKNEFNLSSQYEVYDGPSMPPEYNELTDSLLLANRHAENYQNV